MEIKERIDSDLAIDDFVHGFGQSIKDDFNFFAQELLKYNPNADLNFLKKVFAFACFHHKNDYRKSGQRYYVHLLLVALYLIQKFHIYDEIYLAAAFLHDTIEDTQTKKNKVTRQRIMKTFGSEKLANVVEALTKISRESLENLTGMDYELIKQTATDPAKYKSLLENKNVQKGLTYCKLLTTFIQDPNVIVIKLSDRYHNMQTLHYFDKNKEKSKAIEKQREISNETLQFYVGFAKRLGFNKVALELQNMAFRYISEEDLEQKIRELTRSKIQNIYEELSLFEKIIKDVSKKNNWSDLHVFAYHRPPYEVYNLTNRLQNLDAVRDFAYLIISVPDEIEMEHVASEIIRIFPLRFYSRQSMQFSENEFEVIKIDLELKQDQVQEIYLIKNSDYDILYQIDTPKVSPLLTKKLIQIDEETLHTWSEWMVYNILTHGEQAISTIWRSINKNLFEDKIKCFNIDQTEYYLPVGATALDFAFAISPEVGLRFKAIRIKEKYYNEDYILSSNQTLQVITNKDISIQADWLNKVIDYRAIVNIYNYLIKDNKLNLDNIQIQLEATKPNVPHFKRKFQVLFYVKGLNRKYLVSEIYQIFQSNNVAKLNFQEVDGNMFEGVFTVTFTNLSDYNSKVIQLLNVRNVKYVNAVNVNFENSLD